jgi:glycosyltransferase involved in cell wall biosynthesis
VTSETASISVVHVAPTIFGHGGLFGGGERYPVELARASARMRAVSCRLVTFGPRPAHYTEPSGLRVRVVKPLTYLRGHPARALAPNLHRALRGADVVHVHHLRSTPGRTAAVACLMRRTACVVTDHGLAGGTWFGLLPRLFDRCLAVSRYSATNVGMPEAKTRVIYGGADPQRFAPQDAPRDGVLFVGRLTPHKGVDRLIRALPAGAHLTIAGTRGHDPHPPASQYPAYLHALARGRAVRFVEAVDDGELAALYRRAAVVVVPSVHTTCYGDRVPVSELLGLTTLEAMASGTPVIASNIGGLPEIVTDDVTGRLVTPGDVDHLRAVLTELLTDHARARRFGANARRVAATEFTWERCAQRCLDAYRELLP